MAHKDIEIHLPNWNFSCPLQVGLTVKVSHPVLTRAMAFSFIGTVLRLLIDQFFFNSNSIFTKWITKETQLDYGCLQSLQTTFLTLIHLS